MKKLVCVIIISLPLLSGCGTIKQMESDYVIKVTGSPGVVFKGNYTAPGISGLPIPVEVNNTVPTEYKAKGVTVVCVFRNAGEKGSLKVIILKDKKVVDSAETSQPYGVIAMGKILNQQGVMNLIINKVLDLIKI